MMSFILHTRSRGRSMNYQLVPPVTCLRMVTILSCINPFLGMKISQNLPNRLSSISEFSVKVCSNLIAFKCFECQLSLCLGQPGRLNRCSLVQKRKFNRIGFVKYRPVIDKNLTWISHICTCSKTLRGLLFKIRKFRHYMVKQGSICPFCIPVCFFNRFLLST